MTPKSTKTAPTGEHRRTRRVTVLAAPALALALLVAAPLASATAATKAPPADGTPAGAADVVTLLERPWQEQLTAEQLDAAAASLKPRADEAVAVLVAAFNRNDQTFVYRHRAVQVLERLATPAARAALLDVAMGRSAEQLPSMKQWAARGYLATPGGKADPLPLLAADDPGVLNASLLAARGTQLDQTLLDRVLVLLRREGGKSVEAASALVAVRHAAAEVLAADPGEKFAAEKVAALVEVITRVPQATPDGGKATFLSHWTVAETSYHRYLSALARIKASDGPLRDATAKAEGVPRDLLFIARAERGDRTALDGVRAILTDEDNGMRRAWAARALPAIGTPDDLPLLRRLAETDPLERESGSDVGLPAGQPKLFPVRDAARDALREMEKRR